MEKYGKLLKKGIIPVVCPESKDELDTIIKALFLSETEVLEITLRNSFAFESISYIKKSCPELTVGAGTVNSADTLKRAIETGADFLVSPGFLDELHEEAKKANIPFLPGASTPGEILKMSSMGYKILKFFPAECSGGTKALSLYKGAFSGVSFVPTGGITLENVESYLKLDNVLACGGSFMLPKDMLKSGDAEGIKEIIKQCERK
ncbi:MAG: bifunctional 4-hydroxy-2-oxoglutarate aldolase/2-dehydro-3-deoxy-phosphogluconate aldolase [Clostridia bacterium]|nr:bifunctional 4-hydroxy-2-oxoglutarate aldolase/2-dehydro-3-deoxy-phosphogluconate aldolase [Clostridia bacterium]